MTPAVVTRERCVVCGSRDLSPILTIPSFAMFQGCVRFAPRALECAPMAWEECVACGSAQIAALPPVAEIYQAGHATGIGQAWARHHAAFASFLMEHVRGPIADVGGGSGTLAAAYRKAGGTQAWTILEPNALASESLPEDVAVTGGFLDCDSLSRLQPSTIVLCHVLEHVSDLNAALADITAALPADGRVLIAWPELESWVARGLAGALNFEHSFYVTLARLKRLFGEYGWRLQAEERWLENDTRFLAFARGPVAEAKTPVGSPARAIASYFAGFRNRATAITKALARYSGDLFLMPASVYTQALIAGGLEPKRFVALLDNAPIKQGARLYGTPLNVLSPSEGLNSAHRPLVVLNAGAHDAEIASGLRQLRRDVAVLSAPAPWRLERQGLQAWAGKTCRRP